MAGSVYEQSIIVKGDVGDVRPLHPVAYLLDNIHGSPLAERTLQP